MYTYSICNVTSLFSTSGAHADLQSMYLHSVRALTPRCRRRGLAFCTGASADIADLFAAAAIWPRSLLDGLHKPVLRGCRLLCAARCAQWFW